MPSRQNKKIKACLIVDDFPINPSHFARKQRAALGVPVESNGIFGKEWEQQTPFFPVEFLKRFADFVEELNIKGKFTVVPCPGALGQMDTSIKGVSQNDLHQMQKILRTRIASRFDITPEILTHTMALDPLTGVPLPHCETPWVTKLCVDREREKLEDYLRKGWSVLRNIGLTPHGLTIPGGLPDFSGILDTESELMKGKDLDFLAEVLLDVEQGYNPEIDSSYIFIGGYSPDNLEAMKPIIKRDNGTVFELMENLKDDILLDVFDGRGDVDILTDKLISKDTNEGLLIEAINKTGFLCITVHAQTLDSRSTGKGLTVLHEVCRRLNNKYSTDLIWCTPSEVI